MSKSIPEKWLVYSSYGSVIKGTKILPFKVPLKEAVSNNLEPEKQFTTSILMKEFPRLKFVIDLTNTNRYYDKSEFTKSGIRYEKIAIQGRQVPPSEVVKIFFKVMDDFMSTSAKDEIVGIHCTHGVNRTGYLICRYLMQQLNWKREDCLKAFEEARGHSIEREIYLNALKKVPQEKIDTSKVHLEESRKRLLLGYTKRPSPYNMRPPVYISLPRGFGKEGPYSPSHFGFGGPPPGFHSIPPPPGMPPILPLPGPPPMYRPRPFRYGPPPRPAMPPPPHRPGYPIPGFPPPCPPRTPGGTRLSHGPPTRLPPPKMPPPPPPPPPPSLPSSSSQSAPVRPIVLKRMQKRKPPMRNGMTRNHLEIIRRNSQMNRNEPKLSNEQDFTIDTFEENLLAVSSQPTRWPTKRRYNQSK